MVKLRYTGHGEYIMGVPARDLTDDDLKNVACAQGQSVEEATAMLIQRGLYEKDEKYVCEECGKEYVSYPAFHKHGLSHIPDNQEQEFEIIPVDENPDSEQE